MSTWRRLRGRPVPDRRSPRVHPGPLGGASSAWRHRRRRARRRAPCAAEPDCGCRPDTTARPGPRQPCGPPRNSRSGGNRWCEGGHLPHAGRVQIRTATEADWPAISPFLLRIVSSPGETYTYPRDMDADAARGTWMLPPPGRTVVAVDDDGTVLGSAKMNPNHMGGAAHIAGASFMVDPDHAGKGVGRALGEHALEWARREGYRAMQFNAVVETNTAAVGLWKSLARFRDRRHPGGGVPAPSARVCGAAHHVPAVLAGTDSSGPGPVRIRRRRRGDDGAAARCRTDIGRQEPVAAAHATGGSAPAGGGRGCRRAATSAGRVILPGPAIRAANPERWAGCRGPDIAAGARQSERAERKRGATWRASSPSPRGAPAAPGSASAPPA